MAAIDWAPAEQELIVIMQNHNRMMRKLAEGPDRPLFNIMSDMADMVKITAEKLAALDAKHGES